MKTILRLIVILAVVFGSAVSVAGQEVSVISKVRGIYLGSNGAILYDGPVLQTEMIVTAKSGVWFDLWTSTSNNTKLDFDKEVDLMLGYGRQVGHFNVALDGQYYFVQGGDVANLNFDWAVANSLVSPYVRAEIYFPRQNDGPRAGTMSIAGLRSNVKVAPKLGLALEGWGKRDSGCFGFEEAVLVQGHVLLKASLTDRTSLIGGVRMSKPVTSVSDGRKGETVWEIALSRRFK